MKKYLVTFLIVFGLTLPAVAFAKDCDSSLSPVASLFATKFCTANELIIAAIKLLLTVAGSVAILFIIIGGFQLITSYTQGSGDKKVIKAKQTITNAVVGLAIILLAYTIISVTINAVQNQGSSTPATNSTSSNQTSQNSDDPCASASTLDELGTCGKSREDKLIRLLTLNGENATIAGESGKEYDIPGTDTKAFLTSAGVFIESEGNIYFDRNKNGIWDRVIVNNHGDVGEKLVKNETLINQALSSLASAAKNDTPKIDLQVYVYTQTPPDTQVRIIDFGDGSDQTKTGIEADTLATQYQNSFNNLLLDIISL